jgi:hypothetical protein
MKLQWVIMILSVGLMLFVVVVSEQEGAGAGPGPGLEKATFAGGCFWCMEPAFDKLEGVKSVVSGYTGGAQNEPDLRRGVFRSDGSCRIDRDHL